MNSNSSMLSPKSKDISIISLIHLPILSIIAGIIYSYATFTMKFDPIIVGPIAMIYIAIFLPALLIVQKKKIKTFNKLVIVGLVSVLLAFGARFATSGYLFYNDYIVQETQYEKEEGIYVSEKEVILFVNDYLKSETGYDGYLGAFIWDRQNTNLTSKSESSGSNVGFWGGIGLDLAELLVALGLILFGLPQELRKKALFCEKCNEFKVSQSYILGQFKDLGQFKEILQNKSFDELKKSLKPDEAQNNNFTSLLIYECPHCKAEGSSAHEIDLIAQKGAQKTKEGTRILYNSEELKQLFKVLEKIKA